MMTLLAVNWGNIFTVTWMGILLVFCLLVLLVFILKIFSFCASFSFKKAKQEVAAKVESPAKQAVTIVDSSLPTDEEMAAISLAWCLSQEASHDEETRMLTIKNSGRSSQWNSKVFGLNSIK